jgi:beta-lactamase superfamily II metal-dependent hydrolase
MLKLHIIQAEYGDCFIIEYGLQSNSKYILVDGGPDSIYDNHLKGQLQNIKNNGGQLELLILSHVDDDHIIGLLDFLSELRQQRANKKTETISVNAIWHNTFSQTVGKQDEIENRLKTLLINTAGAKTTLALTNNTVLGIGQGNQLNTLATMLNIPVNIGTPHNLICLDDLPQPIVIANLHLQIVGPTMQNLGNLKKSWVKWLDKYEDAAASADPSLLGMVDKSVPNLSSIMILAEAEGKTILLTGDGRGDNLIQGLKQARLLTNGKIHVDVLKLPHHGSERDVDKDFFKTVTADKYIISANGRYGNPDLSTLSWIVETAKEQKRNIEIFITNETPSTQKFEKDYNSVIYGYNLIKMNKDAHEMTLEISK